MASPKAMVTMLGLPTRAACLYITGDGQSRVIGGASTGPPPAAHRGHLSRNLYAAGTSVATMASTKAMVTMLGLPTRAACLSITGDGQSRVILCLEALLQLPTEGTSRRSSTRLAQLWPPRPLVGPW